MAYEKISGGAKKFVEAGDTVEGFLVGVTPPKGDGNNVLHFQDLKSLEAFDAYSSTALNNILVDGDDNPEIKKGFDGCAVKITMTGFGTKKKGMNAPKQFDVFVDRKNKIKAANRLPF